MPAAVAVAPLALRQQFFYWLRLGSARLSPSFPIPLDSRPFPHKSLSNQSISLTIFILFFSFAQLSSCTFSPSAFSSFPSPSSLVLFPASSLQLPAIFPHILFGSFILFYFPLHPYILSFDHAAYGHAILVIFNNFMHI